jgi:hypothetical protein
MWAALINLKRLLQNPGNYILRYQAIIKVKIRIAILICCLALCFGYAQAQVVKDTVRVANHPKSQMARILDTCRTKLKYTQRDIKNGQFSTSYEIGFFKQTLKNKLLYSYDAFRCSNFTIGKNSSLQLGVSEFIYKDQALANRVFKYLQSKDKLSLSEMLIIFKPVQIGTSVFIILSETPDDASIKKLFSAL